MNRISCNPIAFLAEQAGGIVVDGAGKRIMEISPEAIHHRTPFFTGSRQRVEQIESFIHESAGKD